MKLKGLAVWRRCNTYKRWSIEQMFIDNESYSSDFGSAKKQLERYLSRYLTDPKWKSDAKFIGLKHKITPITIIAFKPRQKPEKR